jgi:YbbR domain-containing protein
MKTRNLRARLLADWPAKVLSLAIALLIFFFYRLNRLEERYISVPLSVTTNDEYVPASQYPRSVRLSLRGESSALFQIQEDDLKASIDLSAVRAAGLSRSTVQIEKRGGALGIDPLEIMPEPAEVTVNMEHKTSRVVPVTPTFRGYLDPGWNLKSFDLTPGEVEISGPESAVGRVVDVVTEAIDLSGRMSDFMVKPKLVRGNPLISVVGTDSVEFRGTVQKSLAMKSFPAVGVAAENLADYLALEGPLPAVRVDVKSASSDIHALELPPGAVSVDFSPVRKPGAYTLPVVVALPSGVTLDVLVPSTVSVRVVARQGPTE